MDCALRDPPKSSNAHQEHTLINSLNTIYHLALHVPLVNTVLQASPLPYRVQAELFNQNWGHNISTIVDPARKVLSVLRDLRYPLLALLDFIQTFRTANSSKTAQNVQQDTSVLLLHQKLFRVQLELTLHKVTNLREVVVQSADRELFANLGL